MIRRTSMFFTVHPPTKTIARGWITYIGKLQEDIRKQLLYRMVRKSSGGKAASLMITGVEMRHLNPKWHDKTGTTCVVEAKATWYD